MNIIDPDVTVDVAGVTDVTGFKEYPWEQVQLGKTEGHSGDVYFRYIGEFKLTHYRTIEYSFCGDDYTKDCFLVTTKYFDGQERFIADTISSLGGFAGACGTVSQNMRYAYLSSN